VNCDEEDYEASSASMQACKQMSLQTAVIMDLVDASLSERSFHSPLDFKASRQSLVETGRSGYRISALQGLPDSAGPATVCAEYSVPHES